MLLLALLPPAHAAPLVDGERLEWSVAWLGVPAGRAWATLRARGEGWAVEAGCRSAEWLAGLYPIDDWLLSEWGADGSARYRTRFREGRFLQDQDMRFGPEAFVVARTQWIDEAWKSWEDRHAPVAGAHDPVSAFYRVREVAPPVGETRSLPLWTGRRGATVRIVGVAASTVDGVAAWELEVLTVAGEDVKGRMRVWLSDDEDRVPLAAEIDTRAGAVRVTLASRALTR